MNFLYYSLMVLFVLVAFLLMLIVLIQKGRGGGLASAFGGVGGNTAFGSKTGDVLTWATSIVFAVFVCLAIVLNLLANSIATSGRPGASSTSESTPAGESAPSTDTPSGNSSSPATPTTQP